VVSLNSLWFCGPVLREKSCSVAQWPVWLNCHWLKLMSGRQFSVFWTFPVCSLFSDCPCCMTSCGHVGSSYCGADCDIPCQRSSPVSWNKSADVGTFSVTLNKTVWFLLHQNAHCTEGTADALKFKTRCLTTQLRTCLHTRPCVPVASTKLPQWQEWGLPSSEPSLNATVMRTALSLSRRPHAVIGNARSQSPLCGALAARRHARWSGDVRVSCTAVTQPRYQVCPMLTVLTPSGLWGQDDKKQTVWQWLGTTKYLVLQHKSTQCWGQKGG